MAKKGVGFQRINNLGKYAHKGYQHTEETKKKMSLSKKGILKPKGFGNKISKALKGRKRSKEHCENISKAKKKAFKEGRVKDISGKNNPMYGKPSWNKGLKGEEYLNHFPGGRIWCDGLTKETDKRVAELSEKSTKTRRNLIEKGLLTPWNKGKPFLALEKNPRWLGGKSFEPYGLEFNNKLKEEIRERDGFYCQICFKHQEELSRILSIHHIDYNKLNNHRLNLISLCISCHLSTNLNRDLWQSFFVWRYNFMNFMEVDLKWVNVYSAYLLVSSLQDQHWKI